MTDKIKANEPLLWRIRDVNTRRTQVIHRDQRGRV